MHTRRTLVIASLLAVCGSTAGAQVTSWLNPVDGNWNEDLKWDTGMSPNSSVMEVMLGLSGAYTVFTTNNWSINDLTISNADATLSIGGTQHTLLGDLMNDGTVLVNTDATIFNKSLYFDADSVISGSGSIVLNGLGGPDDANVWVDGDNVVTHALGHSIRGSGRLLGAMNNNGLIVADEPAGAGLQLEGLLDQTGGGLAGAENGARLLLGSGGTTIGGELFTNTGGEIFVNQNNHHFDGVNLTGDLVLPGSGRNLIIDSTFQNNGTMTLNPELNVFNATLRFDNDVTIEGSGTITLHSAGDFGDAKLLSNGAVTITIGTSQTVEGSGSLDAASMGLVVNRGTINANDPAQALGLDGAHLGDGGIYRADGGELNLRNGSSVSNAVFDSSAGGRVELDISGAASVSDSTNLGDMIIRGGGGRLDIEGTIVNDGVISLNPEGNIFNANMRTLGGATLNGSGSVVMKQVGSTGDARIYTEDGAILTIGANQTVRGSGQIETIGDPVGSIVNLGVINGDDAAFDMTPARELELRGHHDGMGVGVYRSDDGILQLGNTLDLSNGTFDSSGAGFVGVVNGGTATLSNTTNLGDMRIFGNGGKIVLMDDFTNEGTLTINSNSNIFNALLEFGADAVLDGAGTIRMIAAGDLGDAQLDADAGVDGTIWFDQTVAGSGTIEGRGADGRIINVGLILADDPAMNLQLKGNHIGTPMAGAGTYRAADGCVLSIGSGAFLVGGILESDGSGEVAATAGGSDLVNGVNNGTLGVWGSGVTLRLTDSFVNDGTIHINSTANIFNASLRLMTDGLEISGTGEIVMTAAGNPDDAQLETDTVDIVGTLGENQTLRGEGLLNGPFEILGTIDPGGLNREFRTDDITLADSSHVIFDLGGDTAPNFDRFDVRGGHTMALDGTATINLETGYAPSFGDTWDVIDGLTTGTFDEVVTGMAPPGQVYRVIYEPDRVYVILTCDADLSGDGVIDFFDVSEFLSYFSAQDVRGDLNNDGVFNFFDVSVFLQLYGQGCNP